MIRDLVDGRLIPCCSSGETIEIFVEADYETLPEERGRFAIVSVARQQFSQATGNAARWLRIMTSTRNGVLNQI
jgi:hypothetical protein